MDPEQRQRIIGYFLEESQEYLELLEPGVQDLASALADPERINELYRAAHSIKGGAAMLELHGIQKVSYRLESSLKYIKGNAAVRPNAAIQATLLQAVEGLQQLTEEVRETLDLSEGLSAQIWETIEPAFDELDAVLEQQVTAADADTQDTSGSEVDLTAASAEPAMDLPAIAETPEVTDADADLDELSWDDMADLSDLNATGNSGAWLSTKSSAPEESPIEGLDELANLFEENPLDSDDSWNLDSSESIATPTAATPAHGAEDDDAQTLEDLFNDELLGDSGESLASYDEPAPVPAGSMAANASNDLAQNTMPSDASLDASFDDLFDAVDQSLEASLEASLPLEQSPPVEASKSPGESALEAFADDAGLGELESSFEDELDFDLEDSHLDGSNLENSSNETNIGSASDGIDSALDAIDDALDSDASSLDLESFDNSDASDLDSLDAQLDSLGLDDFGEDFGEDDLSGAPGDGELTSNGLEVVSDADDGLDFLDLESDLAGSEDESSTTAATGADLSNDPVTGDTEPLDAFSTLAAEAALDSLESELGYNDGTEATASEASSSEALDDLGLGDLESDLAAMDDGAIAANHSLASDPLASDALASDALASDESLLGSDNSDDELAALLGEDSAALDGGELDGADPLSELGGVDHVDAATEAGQASDDLDALLDDVSDSNEQSFNDLDALLDGIAGENSGDEEFGDEFNDLDTLLGADLLEAPTAEPASGGTGALEKSASDPSSDASSSNDVDFADMEELLQQAQSIGGQAASSPAAAPATPSPGRSRSQRLVEQSMRVPVKTLDNLSNLVGEMVVTRNSLEGDQERLRMALDKLGGHTQQLSDVGQQLQDLYERSLLENALLNSRRKVMGIETLTTAGIAAATATNSGTHSGSSEEDLDDLELDRFTGFHTLSQDIIELIVRIKESTDDIDFLINESLDQVARNFRQTTSQLQEDVNRSRMIPFSQTADRLPRAVREISRKCGKDATLTVDGRETLIDKMLVEQLHDPLTHLINNAVTHGIETQDERILSGKPPTGNIRLQAFYQGNQTVISIADDGAGIDPQVIKRKAIEKGLLRPDEAENLGISQLYDFLFHAGFSTRDTADAFAGRGVGMDVVRTRLQELRGTIVIDSEIGKGTTFTIRLPLTLSITKALHCISNRARIAFPFDGVEDMFDIPRDQLVKNDDDQDCIQWRDMLLPVRELSDLLRYNRTIGRSSVYAGTSDDDMLALVILRSAGEYLAINVDRVEGEMDIVIKQLEGPVPKPTGIAGATVLADGQVMPIADVLELIDLSKGRTRQGANALWEAEDHVNEPTETPASDPLVLIVDDSITVRELLSMSFAKYGYRVEQARDGQEAWEKLRSGLPCNLIFCDIEMPRMTGLELLERMQKDEYLSTLPIAMLTSRGADRHRNLAAKFGARGYFTKPYLEESLLEAANRLLKGEVLINAPAETKET